ncbi:hypothetical protein EmuJ_001165100 [Echinococcus multilocularis]|uniref:Uncharacterized protein n=1 Tax=Echinococcus multilocularis TaxID=6211 RepID=A0A068XXY3_ECHMU|nr:hypothetical protein EmuJ_001165100 [Echinococcus multilocularis]
MSEHESRETGTFYNEDEAYRWIEEYFLFQKMTNGTLEYFCGVKRNHPYHAREVQHFNMKCNRKVRAALKDHCQKLQKMLLWVGGS